METQRKPYYVLRYKTSNLVLHEGIGIEVYPNSGKPIQLYFTDEEVQKFDGKKIGKELEPYNEVMKNRALQLPVELILYAICEVLYEGKEESDE